MFLPWWNFLVGFFGFMFCFFQQTYDNNNLCWYSGGVWGIASTWRLQPPESTPSAPLIGAAPGAENFVRAPWKPGFGTRRFGWNPFTPNGGERSGRVFVYRKSLNSRGISVNKLCPDAVDRVFKLVIVWFFCNPFGHNKNVQVHSWPWDLLFVVLLVCYMLFIHCSNVTYICHIPKSTKTKSYPP